MARNAQCAAAVGITQAVFQQIIEQLHQAVRIAEDHGAVRQRQLYFQIATGKAFAECTGGHFQNINHINGRFLIGQRPFVRHRKLMQIVHQLGQRSHFRLQRGDGLRRKLTHTVLNRLQLTA
ncbi:hypothetical protein D3C76_1320630 [compost metagenome]